jgi:phosphoglycerate dehydrogenase-like enzyme
VSRDAEVVVVDATEADLPRLERLCAAVPTRVETGPADAAELVRRAAGARVLATLYTYTQVSAEVLDGLDGLQLAITRTAGYSHIDVAAADRLGVAVASVPDAPTVAVAEYTFGALLAARRRLYDAVEDSRGGAWDFTGHRGADLYGHTLGVVGLGTIGRRVAELGQAFGMRVLGWARRPMGLPGVEQVELDELLERSDVVSLNVALTDETRHLLDGARMDRMRPDAWLVNTARGEVVDTAALCERLRDGRLGGACLDVAEGEPLSGEQAEALAGVPNVFLTPHISWHTEGTLGRQFDSMTDTILAFCDGRPIRTVSRPAGAL